VKEKASMAYDHLQKMEQKQAELHTEMAVRTDCESEAYHNIIERATDLQELFQMSGIHNFEAEMAATEKELPTPEGYRTRNYCKSTRKPKQNRIAS
jgi:hypothetical protein